MRISSRLMPPALAAICCLAPGAGAEVFELSPTGMTSDCNEELENVWNAAQPGDEIILNAGVYAQGCRRAISVNGTAQAPIIVRAADGADVLVTRPEATSTQHNNIEIAGSHMIIRGLRFQYGSAGVTFLGGSHHIRFEDNEVFDTYDNAVRLNSGDTDSFVIRNNEIHTTGRGGSTGEGMYIGCHSGNCVASNHLIEGNYIHDLESQSGGGNDGIEIKFRSHSNVVRGNRIHNTTIGQDFPCIFVYGHGVGEPNIIENNIVSACGEAILVTADAIVRNNIVLDSSVNGIHVNRQNPAPSVQNLTIVNNTVFGSHPVCARLNAGSASGVTVANNAFYCENSTAVSGNLGSASILSNYVSGNMSSGSVDNDRFFAGGSANNAFVNPAADDFRLASGSVLIDAGDGTVTGLPATDYAGNARISGADVDVGAFEFASGGGAVPVVSLTANPTTVNAGQDVTLSWQVSGADSCSAASSPQGVWSGAVAAGNSSQTIAGLQEDTEFVLSCDNQNGTGSDAVQVAVTAPPDGDDDDDGLPDDWERANFGGLGQGAGDDPDGDGFDNAAEFAASTDPNDAAITPEDTDGDSMPDADELTYFGNLGRDGSGDFDGDGVSDATEIANGSDPTVNDTVSNPDPPNTSSGGGSVGLLSLLCLAPLLRRRRRFGQAATRGR